MARQSSQPAIDLQARAQLASMERFDREIAAIEATAERIDAAPRAQRMRVAHVLAGQEEWLDQRAGGRLSLPQRSAQLLARQRAACLQTSSANDRRAKMSLGGVAQTLRSWSRTGRLQVA